MGHTQRQAGVGLGATPPGNYPFPSPGNVLKLKRPDMHDSDT